MARNILILSREKRSIVKTWKRRKRSPSGRKNRCMMACKECMCQLCGDECECVNCTSDQCDCGHKKSEDKKSEDKRTGDKGNGLLPTYRIVENLEHEGAANVYNN